MLDAIDGKKTYIGGAMMALGALLTVFGNPELGEPIKAIGQAVSVIGIGHKIAKAG